MLPARATLRGQAMVEFAVILLPVLLIVVGLIQFGLLFGANVTLTNAAREGARAGTVYVYDHSRSRTWNDAERCGAILAAARGSMGFLTTSAPNFSTTLNPDGSCPTPSGETQVNGDLTVSYCASVNTPDAPCPDTSDPGTACLVDTREDCLVRVTLRYGSAIIVPFMGQILGSGSGLFVQSATVTMVIN
ncbi:MAG TPA: TadE/TadG family type IV pilus assembly protein [Candidatus Limnocylindria bacterium]|nr:TadE/TadG family type IV pilus assembly protein [Candidatus Limnocylindria bacterium]